MNFASLLSLHQHQLGPVGRAYLCMEVVANNIANASSTRSADGGPFRGRKSSFQRYSTAPSGLRADWGDLGVPRGKRDSVAAFRWSAPTTPDFCTAPTGASRRRRGRVRHHAQRGSAGGDGEPDHGEPGLRGQPSRPANLSRQMAEQEAPGHDAPAVVSRRRQAASLPARWPGLDG